GASATIRFAASGIQKNHGYQKSRAVVGFGGQRFLVPQDEAAAKPNCCEAPTRAVGSHHKIEGKTKIGAQSLAHTSHLPRTGLHP
ncbi:MAG: hypothetical protein JZU63_04955, partial [Rhodoferax sp.]|nr:hypothetical protein [Rhodoferax sp.]